MPRFIFICEHHNTQKQTIDTKVTNEFISESVGDVLTQFECFLRGAGYVFDGRITYVPNFTDATSTTDEIKIDNVEHTNEYYDEDRNR